MASRTRKRKVVTQRAKEQEETQQEENGRILELPRREEPPVPPLPALLLDVDPLTPPTDMLLPLAVKRVLDFFHDFPQETSAELFVRGLLSRIARKDPAIRFVIAIEPPGQIVGHAVATIETDGVNRWVYGWQVKVDRPGTQIVPQLIKMAREWGQQHGATRLLMASFHPEEFWRERYGFETVRHVMSLDFEKVR